MLRAMLGFALLLAAYGVAFLIGMPITALIKHLTGKAALANVIGTAVWMLVGTVIAGYLSLYTIQPPPSKIGLYPAGPSDNLAGAAFRFGFIFAMISAALAEVAGANTATTVCVAVACTVLGCLFGYDIQRRARRRRGPRSAAC